MIISNTLGRRPGLCGLFVLGALFSAQGCELIATADRSRIDAGAGEPTGGSGGAGGDPSCVAADCPGNDTDCSVRACEAGQCTTQNTPSGTACQDPEATNAKVCDGVGSCVECVSVSDCDGSELCVDLLCVPATCVNGEIDGDESDVDCGGSCSPCENGLDCNTLADCASAFCDAGTCAPCSPGGTDCDASDYCNAGVCVDKLVDGDVCSDAEQCASGFCPGQDGVCCDAACDTTCIACLNAKNGGLGNGTCGVVAADTDPDTECPANAATCQAAGCNGNAGSPACNTAANGTVCRTGSGDDCDLDETCSGGVCPADVFEDASTVCRMGSDDACDPDEMCPGVAGMPCPADFVRPDTFTCRPKTEECDIAEMCTGTPLAKCPQDGVAPQGTLGTPDGCGNYVCDGMSNMCPDTCDGDEDCVPGDTCNTSSGNCM